MDITVISKPNSYIGLLGVDQSVLLLRKGNDLDKSQIFNELDEYSRKQSHPSRYGIDEWEDFAVSFQNHTKREHIVMSPNACQFPWKLNFNLFLCFNSFFYRVPVQFYSQMPGQPKIVSFFFQKFPHFFIQCGSKVFEYFL